MMLLVGTINMITALLIIILEKTKTVGLLKAIGATDTDIRKIFIYNSARLIFRGAFIGNLIGISLVCIQYYFKLIPLDASSYYMQFVPIKLDVLNIFLINIISISISIICMIIPTLIIRKISPARVMRF
jgi:lipoprotein-releasing system permease protein